QYTLQGRDSAEIYRAAPVLAEKMSAIPGVQAVTTDLQLKNPQLRVEIVRDRAAVMGVTPAQIELALSSAFGTRQVSTIYAPTNDYQVIIELCRSFRPIRAGSIPCICEGRAGNWCSSRRSRAWRAGRGR